MIDAIRRQFELGWALTELHLSALLEADFHWEPAELCWTVRPDTDGRWRADFADIEPDPVPVPTIAWLTWHIDYWWGATLASMHALPRRAPTEVLWPGNGPAAVARLHTLAAQWRELLATISIERLAEPASFPWGTAEGRTIADAALWVNVELTKNAAEIGQLRLLRAARA